MDIHHKQKVEWQYNYWKDLWSYKASKYSIFGWKKQNRNQGSKWKYQIISQNFASGTLIYFYYKYSVFILIFICLRDLSFFKIQCVTLCYGILHSTVKNGTIFSQSFPPCFWNTKYFKRNRWQQQTRATSWKNEAFY